MAHVKSNSKKANKLGSKEKCSPEKKPTEDLDSVSGGIDVSEPYCEGY